MSPKVLCIGTVNIDHVYSVTSLLKENESACCNSYHRFWGGKGLNQTVALRKAGAQPFFFSKVGKGDFSDLCAFLQSMQIDKTGIAPVDSATNHGIIQVDPDGNTMILGCANPEVDFSEEEADEIIAQFSAGDVLYLQNEILSVPYIIEKGHRAGMRIVLNPSPLDRWEALPIEKVDWLILNAAEAEQISGENSSESALQQIAARYGCNVVLTMGASGSLCIAGKEVYFQPCIPVRTIDTAGAGDTFMGYFIALLVKGSDIPTALLRAAQASSIVVSRVGTAEVIPEMGEVISWHEKSE